MGKVSVLFVFFVWTIFALYGCFQVEIDFNFDFFINDEMSIYKFRAIKKIYYPQAGETINVYTNSTSVDFFSESTQLTMLEFDEAIHRCKDCEKSWIIPGSLNSWNTEYRSWLDQGLCSFAPDGIDPFTKVLDPSIFESCLKFWLKSDSIGRTYKGDMKINSEDGRLLGYMLKVDVRPLSGLAVEGIPFKLDIE